MMPLLDFRRKGLIKWMLLATGCGGVLMAASTPTPVAAPAPEVAPAPAPPASLADMAIERYQVATRGYELASAGHQPTDAPGFEVLEWMRRRVKARLEVVEPKADRVAFLKQYVEELKRQEQFEERLVKIHLAGQQALLRARYDRLEGEMLLRQVETR